MSQEAVTAEAGEDSAASEAATLEPSLLPEERIGALTQIFREYRPDDAPEIIERVVTEIDSVVTGARLHAVAGEPRGHPARKDRDSPGA